MSELLTPLGDFHLSALLVLCVRLVLALVLGLGVSAIYRASRPMNDEAESFVVTLVLLTILIAMVTQVIGDNVARAFSLVGALSIVRFRTVVRDTQDTAYVIFAVAVGMSVGANHPSVALCGLVIVGLAAVVMTRRKRGNPLTPATVDMPFVLTVRFALGKDPDAVLQTSLDPFVAARRLISVGTARQGMAIEAAYKAALRSEASAGELVNALNRLEGVQSVSLERAVSEEL
jgi:hypothetical protein